MAMQGGKSGLIGKEQHLLFQKRFNKGREVTKAVAVDDEGVERVADAGAAGFGVEDDLLAQFKVAAFVEIGVHNACAGFDDGNLGVVAHKVDQLLAPSWNDHVDVANRIEHDGGGLTLSGEQVNGIGVDAVLFQDAMDKLDNGDVGVHGIAAALQHSGVTRLQAEGKDIEGDIWPCFVDDANDTDGNSHLFQVKPVLKHSLFKHHIERGGERRDVADVGGNGFEPCRVQQQPVNHWVCRIHSLHIFFVGGENGLLVSRYSVGKVAEQAVDRLIGQGDDLAACLQDRSKLLYYRFLHVERSSGCYIEIIVMNKGLLIVLPHDSQCFF